jgi:hypothetical protein
MFAGHNPPPEFQSQLQRGVLNRASVAERIYWRDRERQGNNREAMTAIASANCNASKQIAM